MFNKPTSGLNKLEGFSKCRQQYRQQTSQFKATFILLKCHRKNATGAVVRLALAPWVAQLPYFIEYSAHHHFTILPEYFAFE
jgi:hypothetical protein